MKTRVLLLPSALVAMQIGTLPLAAQSSDTGAVVEKAPELLLELNALQPSDKGCRMTFVVTNDLGAELDQAAFEIALFNDLGLVDRLTVLDFKDLPVGKTKVTRFDLAGADCAKVSRVLINTATECKGAGVEPRACIRQLRTQSRSGTQFGT
ncbi:MAG: hypothetical protein JNL61_18510 [Rhizobiaceae bacterium]|nr:hypothetical protein [Rhizobiaceae bacterium]